MDILSPFLPVAPIARPILRQLPSPRPTPGLAAYTKRVVADLALARRAPAPMLFDGPARWDSVQQGSLNDCWFVSAALAYARNHPQAVEKMIASNPDGSYTVTFPNGQSATVAPLTAGELERCSKSNGCWMGILEKAYGSILARRSLKLPGGLEVRPNGVSLGRPDPLSALDGGTLNQVGVNPFSPRGSTMLASTASVSPLLPVVPGAVPTRPSTIQSELKAALAEGRIVTAAPLPKPLAAVLGDGKLPAPFVRNHVYAVVGYDPKTRQVTVRNPNGESTTVSFDEFVRVFPLVCVQNR